MSGRLRRAPGWESKKMIDVRPEEVKDALQQLVALIVAGRYQQVASNGWLGRLTVEELAVCAKVEAGGVRCRASGGVGWAAVRMGCARFDCWYP